MAINDLSSYLAYLEKKHRLVEISSEVDRELEISTFTDIADRESRYDSKALLFSNVKGYDMPVATNLFASMNTLRELLDNEFVSEVLGNIRSQHFKMPLLKGAKALMSMNPSTVNQSLKGYERSDDLGSLPILKVWPKDAGRFITLPMVISKSPKTGNVNVGTYRMQVYDNKTTGMHWQAQKGGAIHAIEAREEGKELKVSVVIGSDPYNMLSAVMPLPVNVSEFSVSGLLRNSRTVLMKNGDYPEVPANSEIIINGHVDPDEKRIEGPFGDHTGYYSIPEPTNVFHVDEVFAKKNAVYSASVVGFPWHEDAAIGQFFMEFMKPAITMMNESITDVYLPPEGLFTNVCFISINKRFPGEAMKAMFSILGTGQLSFVKMIAVFDSDIDIRDQSKVLWALATRVEPERDIQIIKRTTSDTLDHAANRTAFGSKMLIDATKKMREEGYEREWPDTISMPKEIINEVEKKWKSIRH